MLADKIGTTMGEKTSKVWEEIEIEENLNSGKDTHKPGNKWGSPPSKVVIDIEADVSSVLIVILHFVQGFALFSKSKVCLTLQTYNKKVAMEINAMVQECETTVRKKIALKSGFMVNTGSEWVERNQILWF